MVKAGDEKGGGPGGGTSGVAGGRRSFTDGEASGSEGRIRGTKRIRVARSSRGSGGSTPTLRDSSVEVEVLGDVVGLDDGLGRRKGKGRKKGEVASGSGAGVMGDVFERNGLFEEMRAINKEVREGILAAGVDPGLVGLMLGCAARYEELLVRVLMRNERLRGRCEVMGAASGCDVRSAGSVFAVPEPPVGAPVAGMSGSAPRPVETWAVVVKDKSGVSTPKEVVDKVVRQVGPTLGVRVHGVRPIRGGGAVLRTPSVAEREKVAKNSKFGEVGLEVSVDDRLGPRLVVRGVHPEIKPDEFMGELYELNLRECLSLEEFRKSVRMVNKPWRSAGPPVGVVLECSDEVAGHLLRAGFCYIKWFSFLVREYEEVQSCFRCLGFDHRLRECRYKEDVCRRCGRTGHMVSECVNEVSCRDCRFKGRPAGHLMLSGACPQYSMLVARARARH